MSQAMPDAALPAGAATRLKTVVFCCGAALMALEIAGVRILEPFFGSTVYVWGSIIGIFLGSLSAGYYLGGILSDRHPRMEVLGFLILVSGLFCFLVPWIAAPLCKSLADTNGLDPRIRAVVGSVVLYAIPSILLGMVSPFAVRLAARQVSAMGQTAGSLYALSTLGSIVGTFLASFVLVEWIGSRTTVWGVGATLVLMSALCLIERLRALTVGGMAAGLLVGGGSFDEARRMVTPDVCDEQVHLESLESAYHTIHIIEGIYPHRTGHHSRLMIFNNLIESGAYLDDPEPGQDVRPLQKPVVSACHYTNMLHLGVLLTEKAPKRVLIIGCGGGVGPQAFANDYAGAIEEVDVVDIDPQVFAMARKWFAFPPADDDGVIRGHVEDGRRFLRTREGPWDYVIMDAYTAGGRIPRHLITREFFELVGERLSPEGVVVANIISAVEGPRSRLYRAVYKTMADVYGEDAVYAFPRNRTHGDYAANIILVAAPGHARLSAGEISSRFVRLNGILLKQPGLRDAVRDVQLVPAGLDEVPVLTDDFCPTDSMTAH